MTTEMKVLAKAKPNRKYRWFRNLEGIRLEARTNGEKVFFYSIEPPREVRISEDTVREMFRDDRVIRDRPFLRSENMEFYAVLFRNSVRFTETFSQLISI